MRTCLLALTCSLLLGLDTASAQEVLAPEPPPADPSSVTLSQEQDRELDAWLSAMTKWRRYDAKWSNRPARDGMGRIVEHRASPDAPEWLQEHCAAAAAAHILDLQPRTMTACRLLVDPRAALHAVPPAQAAQIAAEKPPKHSSFLTRVHLDGLWSTASNTGRLYGLVGSHVSLVDVGRLQVFGPPGVLLVSVPDSNGSRRIVLGYTWGLSVRLADVRLFGPTKDMTLFMNLSKLWLAGSQDEQGTRGYEIMGFSIAPRKKQ
jgi:hypothetical protein